MKFSRRIVWLLLLVLWTLPACDHDFFSIKSSGETSDNDAAPGTEDLPTVPDPHAGEQDLPDSSTRATPPTTDASNLDDNQPPPAVEDDTTTGALNTDETSESAGAAQDPAQSSDGVRPYPQAPNSFADLVERVQPAVVNVYTEQIIPQREVRVDPLHGPYSVTRPHRATSLGSGFIVDDEGYILTNTHVIDGAQTVKISTLDGTEMSAAIVGTDPMTDIALLKIRPFEGMQTLPLGDSDTVRVGDWLMAVGNPFGLQSTVTTGILSARGRRNVPIRGEIRYMDFLQTDASINPGNSGGPLIAMDGTVIGINTAINAKGQGIGFAIPTNMTQHVYDDLRSGREVSRSWLGVQIGTPPKDRHGHSTAGALIAAIVRGGPAADAGLRVGDVIVKFGDEIVEGPRALPWLASTAGVGKTIPLVVRRGNEEMHISVRMGQLPN